MPRRRSISSSGSANEAADLPRVVRAAGEAAAGAHPGLQDIADIDAWTTVFNPGVSTLNRLVELTREVDFAAFVFAQDDWTTKGASPEAASGQASPRDNVVFEAGPFGGALGIRRTFILHTNGARLPTDLLGLTSIRYDPDTTPAIVRQINQKLRKAIAAEGRISRLEGDWWQLSLTARTELEPSAVSLLTISRDRAGALQVAGRSWLADGTLSARYWSEASKERADPAGIFYFWKGERTRHPDAPQLEGTGEIKLESVDRGDGYWTTRPEGASGFHARTSGIYLRADPGDAAVLTATPPQSGRHSSNGGSRNGSRSRTPDLATASLRRR